MVLRRTILVLIAGLLLGACQEETPALSDAAAAYDAYGPAPVTSDEAVPVQAVLAEPETYLEQTVKVEGTISDVCQMKGCWLTLDGGPEGNVRIFVA